MSEDLTTENVRQLVLLTFGEPEREAVGPMFDDWLYFLRKEAHDEGYELCWADCKEMGHNE